MRANLRFAAAAAALLGAVWSGVASADWPFGQVVRLNPGYGGECEGCDLSGRLLADARLTNGVFRRANFSHAVLRRADASGSVFEGADFSMADLSHAKLIAANCGGADFEGAILSYSDGSGGVFAAGDFRGADLEGARFIGADFVGASFHGARLTRADFSGADLRRSTGLTRRQLAAACGDSATRLPRGFSIPVCG